jgi:hypothetical protein
MKFLLLVMLATGLWADPSPEAVGAPPQQDGAQAAPASPAAAGAQAAPAPASMSAEAASATAQALIPGADQAESVELHFQAARKLYLDGDRDGALRELNEALKIDPYHPASTKLFETIHDEERSLRQVRLVSPEATPLNAATSPPPPQPSGDSGIHEFWRSVTHFEDRTNRRLDGMDKNLSQVDGQLNQLQAEVDGQKDLMGMLKDGVRRIEGRQDQLMLGLLALLIALIVLLVMTLRMLMNMRGEIHIVESKMHEHPAPKRRY